MNKTIPICIHTWIEPQGEQFVYHPALPVDTILELNQQWTNIPQNPLLLPSQIQGKIEKNFARYDHIEACWVIQPGGIERRGRAVNIVKAVILDEKYTQRDMQNFCLTETCRKNIYEALQKFPIPSQLEETMISGFRETLEITVDIETKPLPRFQTSHRLTEANGLVMDSHAVSESTIANEVADSHAMADAPTSSGQTKKGFFLTIAILCLGLAGGIYVWTCSPSEPTANPQPNKPTQNHSQTSKPHDPKTTSKPTNPTQPIDTSKPNNPTQPTHITQASTTPNSQANQASQTSQEEEEAKKKEEEETKNFVKQIQTIIQITWTEQKQKLENFAKKSPEEQWKQKDDFKQINETKGYIDKSQKPIEDVLTLQCYAGLQKDLERIHKEISNVPNLESMIAIFKSSPYFSSWTELEEINRQSNALKQKIKATIGQEQKRQDEIKAMKEAIEQWEKDFDTLNKNISQIANRYTKEYPDVLTMDTLEAGKQNIPGIDDCLKKIEKLKNDANKWELSIIQTLSTEKTIPIHIQKIKSVPTNWEKYNRLKITVESKNPNYEYSIGNPDPGDKEYYITEKEKSASFGKPKAKYTITHESTYWEINLKIEENANTSTIHIPKILLSWGQKIECKQTNNNFYLVIQK